MITAFTIPVLGDVPGEAFGSHLVQAGEVARHSKHVQYYAPLDRMPHDVARNENMQEILDNGADYLYCIDDDTLVPKGAFPEMLKVLTENKAAIITGHYYRRGLPYTCVWCKSIAIPGEEPQFQQVDALSGLHEIDIGGLGCALIDLAFVRAHLSRPWFEMLKNLRTGDTIIADDTTFYTKIRQAGGLVLGHAGIRCVHLGGRQPICDETIEHLRVEPYQRERVRANLSKGDSNGNHRKQPEPQGRVGDAGDSAQEAGASAEPSHST